jgi:hypothetical protein
MSAGVQSVTPDSVSLMKNPDNVMIASVQPQFGGHLDMHSSYQGSPAKLLNHNSVVAWAIVTPQKLIMA